MSTWVLKLFVIEFAIMAGACAWEHDWKWFGYAMGAMILNGSLLLIKN